MADDEDDTEGEWQGKEGRVEEDEERPTDADKNFQIMSLIHSYSDFTHIDWDRVWDKNIVEFLNTIAFIREFKKREEAAMKEKMRQNSPK